MKNFIFYAVRRNAVLLTKNRDSSRWWWTNDLLEVVLLNINVDNVIDFCTEYADSFGEIELFKKLI